MSPMDQYIYRITHGPPFKPGEEMTFEMLRLASFSTWPKWCTHRPKELASLGFYSIGKGSTVICFSCGIQLDADDKLEKKHRTQSPNCSLFKDLGQEQQDSGFSDEHVVTVDAQDQPFPVSATRTVEPNRSNEQPLGMSNKHASDAAFEIETESEESATPVVEEPVNPQRIFEPSKEIDVSLVRYEGYRLSTFEGRWPTNSFVAPSDMAKTGLYYIGPHDKVQCAFCKGRLFNWKPADNPMQEHRKHFPECPFIQNKSVGNVSAEKSNETSKDNEPNLADTPAGRLGIVLDKPKYFEFGRENKRLDTYKAWPKKSTVSCQKLVKSGLFYTGYSDNVMCFYCGGSLGNWMPGDDPWEEHMKYYPTCGFLKLTKGNSEQADSTSVTDSIKEAKKSKHSKKAKKNKSDAVIKPADVTALPSQALDEGFVEDDEYRMLKQKLETLTEERLCKICMDAERSILFLPCGHTVCCSDCAPALQTCPVCRERIKGSVRINAA